MELSIPDKQEKEQALYKAKLESERKDKFINPWSKKSEKSLNLTHSNLIIKDYDIEIGGGLGPLGGQIWRIGLMGYSAKESNVDRLLNALKTLL